jgi:uncharacterized protein (TIGR02145 family)
MKQSYVIAIATIILSSIGLKAQTTMNIYQSNGSVLQIPLNTIDSITYTINNPGQLATITTLPIGNIANNTAASGGNITNNGGTSVTQRGVVWSTSPNPSTANNQSTDGSGIGNFTSNLMGLTANTTYYVRSYAINSAGTSYGNELNFTTTGGSGSIASLNCNGATNNGTLLASAAASGVSSSVPYTGGNGGTYNGQTVNSTGVTGLTATLTTGSFSNGSGSLTYTITGTPITSGIASFALNIGGQNCSLSRTVNGGGSILNPNLTYGTVADQQGNTYATIVIGGQEWMAENLRTTTYANGDTIPNITDGTQWSNLTAGAWVYYNNDIQYENPYGKLYNWYTVADARNVCPTGWHVPTDLEWTALTNYLGGETVAGGKMKSNGTQYWYSPNFGATNESGFSGLPGGVRQNSGTFVTIGYEGQYYSSTENNANTAWKRDLNNNEDYANRTNVNKKSGVSVRCLRD